MAFGGHPSVAPGSKEAPPGPNWNEHFANLTPEQRVHRARERAPEAIGTVEFGSGQQDQERLNRYDGP